ncbi:hypothetical protein FEM48_Zijuj04G0112500 [Ziziphus jujuba var. spinosa]|uniref:Uncharacterized protein n=1 Tax=Ziziphus jujuba var. spinosa TaxID=714518 RepID=A0A978VJJ8_ZIZJJ|nr:hypothetical protein FEM48_Zijuj04G0112500 [Ziziphus jujuba var. spinosa]
MARDKRLLVLNFLQKPKYKKRRRMGEKEGEDERREKAIASAPSLQHAFKPRGVSQNQLSKFQELHKRRLQIKSKSKIKKKQRGSFSDKSHSKDLSSKDSADKDSNVLNPESHNNEKSSIVQQEIGAAYVVPKQCPKLYWGLDTKERWERKSNM